MSARCHYCGGAFTVPLWVRFYGQWERAGARFWAHSDCHDRAERRGVTA